MWSKYVSNIVLRDFRLPVSEFATEAREALKGKFAVIKVDYPRGNFILPLQTLKLEV